MPRLSALRALAGTFAVAIAAVVVAILAAAPAGARLRLAGASGALRLSQTGAILSATGMAPGASASGETSVENTGDASAPLRLATTALEDDPGPHGGSLAHALVLDLAERAPDGHWENRWHGALDDLDRVDLGDIDAGARREFRFVVSLPDGGTPAGPESGDNTLMSARVDVAYAWQLDDGAQPEAPSSNQVPGTSEDAAAAPTSAADATLPAHAAVTPAVLGAHCSSKRRFTIRLRLPARTLSRTVRVTVGSRRATVRRDGRRLTAVVDLRGATTSQLTVRISGRTTQGRTVRETRRYRTCAERRR